MDPLYFVFSMNNLVPRLICLVFLAPGLYYLSSYGRLLLNNIQLARTGVRVDASVVGLGVTRERTPGQTGTVANYSYTFEFNDSTGKKITVNSAHGYSQHWEPYNDQGLMPIIYNPANPAQNRINSFGRMWLLPIIWILFGLFMTLVGIMGLLPVSWGRKMRGL